MELLTMDEAAASAGVSVRTLKREIAEGKLPVVCIRRRVQIDTRDLMAYLVRSKEVRTPNMSAVKRGNIWYVRFEAKGQKSLGLAAVPVRPRLRAP